MTVKNKHCPIALITAAVTLLLALSCTAAESITFVDVPESDYYHEYIAYLADNNIFKGVSATEFAPDSPMTRAMFVTVLGRMANAKPPSDASPFSDVPENEWYSDYIAWAAENDIVKGYSADIFAPNDVVTEEQALVIIERFCEKFNIALKLGSYHYQYYDTISDYAVDGINKLASAGVFTGQRGNNILDPKAPASRAFAAELLARVSWLEAEQPKPIESLDPASVTAKLRSLETEYPEGMSWTNYDYYEWYGGYYTGGYGCAAFAFILSDAVFGTTPAKIVTDLTDFNLRPGDILRLEGDTHSVIVLEINDNGIIVAEGNYNKSIHWGRVLTSEQLLRSEYVITRY